LGVKVFIAQFSSWQSMSKKINSSNGKWNELLLQEITVIAKTPKSDRCQHELRKKSVRTGAKIPAMRSSKRLLGEGRKREIFSIEHMQG